MISEKMIQALNDQIKMEGQASFLYLAMSAWCDEKGMEGCAQFLRRQSEEEREHMLGIFDYLSEVDALAVTPGIDQPPREFPTVQKLFESVYEHEQKVTQAIHKLLHLALDEQDYTTQHFLQWYVEEQKEEEALMRTILDKIKLIGDGPQALYYIDKEISAINTQVAEGEGENG